MRLLNVHTLEFEVFLSSIPKYAVASHRWASGSESEATIRDVQTKTSTHRVGYRKVEGFAAFTKQNFPDISYMWMDTCCINQESSAEVTEAINSMFKWYRRADVCIAHLADVSTPDDLNAFRNSQWFTRGWTLQELLAPRTVVFVTRKWEVIGHKGETNVVGDGEETRPDRGPSLNTLISQVTGIPERVLSDYGYSKAYSGRKKLEWMADQETTREEDQSYCLLGLFDVTMPVIYGEGRERARKRLLAEIVDLSAIPSDLEIEHEIVKKHNPRSLHEASSSGDLEFIAEFFDATTTATEMLWKWDAGGSLPLHRAVRNGHALVCKLLMTWMNRQAWDRYDLLDVNGETPVHYALAGNSKASEEVLKEFLTDEGLCFAVPTILTERKLSLMRVLDRGGSVALRRAITVARRVLPTTLFCDTFRQSLTTVANLSGSDQLVAHWLLEMVQLKPEEAAAYSETLVKSIDLIYTWATFDRVRRLVALHRAVELSKLLGSEQVNFVGKAIVAHDLQTLNAIHAIDPGLLSAPVGFWTRNWRTLPNQTRFGPWKPLRFAVLLGHLPTVQLIAQLAAPEDYTPPHLSAVHQAAVAASENWSPGHREIWPFLRDLGADDHDELDASNSSIINLRVEIAVDWATLLFPHSGESSIEDVKIEPSVSGIRCGLIWDKRLFSVEHNAYPSSATETCVTLNIRVRMRSVTNELSEGQEKLVHLDFMHGWNDFYGGGGRGCVHILPSSEDDQTTDAPVIWFRENNQHEFTSLKGDAKLSSPVCVAENHHNLRSWQLKCVRT